MLLHRPLEDFRQALHLGFGQGVARAHAVTEEQVFDQVGGEVHRLTIGVAHKGQRADAPVHPTGVGINQVGATQLPLRVVDTQAVVIQDLCRQRIVGAGLEPLLVGIVDEVAVGDLLAEELVVVEEVAVEPLDKLAQRRAQRRFLGGALAVGKAHGRGRIADMQGPHMGDDIAPGGDLDLHPQFFEDGAHVGDGLLQRQVLALDKGAVRVIRRHHQQRLGVLVQVVHFLDLEFRPGLDHLLHGAAVDGAQNALPVLVGNILR